MCKPVSKTIFFDPQNEKKRRQRHGSVQSQTSWISSGLAQGVIYLVSHRSLRIKFWALRTNCETQSKKVRIKIILCEAVQSMHRTILLTRFAAACAIAIASTISRSAACAGAATEQPGAGPEHASSGRLPHNALFPDPDLSAHSFRESSTGRSTWWGRVVAFEDFLEMAVNLSTVSTWKKYFEVLGEWLHYDEATMR